MDGMKNGSGKDELLDFENDAFFDDPLPSAGGLKSFNRLDISLFVYIFCFDFNEKNIVCTHDHWSNFPCILLWCSHKEQTKKINSNIVHIEILIAIQYNNLCVQYLSLDATCTTFTLQHRFYTARSP